MKRKFKNYALSLLAVGVAGLSLAACSKGEDKSTTTTTTEVTKTNAAKDLELHSGGPTGTQETISTESVTKVTKSDAVYVGQVENLPDDFYMGMDASAVIALENAGVKYYDYDGNEQDVFKTLAESGVNCIRVRVWNDPYDKNGNGYGGGNCDIRTALEIGKRATKYGMSVSIDFHYSDFWADPAKQMVPKAWKYMDIYEKRQALYEYTYDSLELLWKAGVNVSMVQVGNETTGGLAGETSWDKICMLMDAGSKAIRQVYPEALVVVHFANPEKENRYTAYASYLKNYNVDYDVFASSYYPYWHGTLDNLSKVLSTIATKYNKKVMVAETSWAYTLDDFDFNGNTIGEGASIDAKDYPYSISGQVNNIRNITDTLVNHTTNAIGVFYWEGTWIPVGTTSYEENKEKWEKYGTGWASSYASDYDPKDAGQYYGGCVVENQALFDPTGHPLESLKVFQLMRTGNIIEKYADGVEDAAVTFNTNAEVILPSQVNVIYCDNSKVPTDVVWEDFDIDAAKKKGNGTYEIKGIAAGTEVTCYLTLLEYNYVQNYSFEQMGRIDPWTTNVVGTLGSDYKVQVTTENPKAGGSQAFHFWAKNANTVNFAIEQEMKDLTTGKYKLQVSLLGGDDENNDASKQESIMYVKVNGEIKYSQKIKYKGYSSGYQDYLLTDVEVNEGDTVVVGVQIIANAKNAWGDIDNVMFNYQG